MRCLDGKHKTVLLFADNVFDAVADLVERALVFRLFLRPNHRFCVRIFRQFGFNLVVWERIQLLNADDSDIIFQFTFGSTGFKS